ncbi:MAG TPA: sn-glycerol-3-phosphate ABC transporter ATP-binding protein UgpC [Opitutaceae bacterium]|nr:sn-glycerol-3-phosphate ABC transporter ATP-binding protein UgpC [Opitutaceae bacterium]
MSHVKLQQLTKTYVDKSGAPVTAVQNVDLEIRDGEFMVLVGPSGCGKSTTLRMVAGLEEISRGTVAIDDRVVNEVPPKDRDIAMVFQNYALYPHMSVYENMAFGLKLRKFPRAEIDGRVREAAALLGLDGLLDRKPKALSGGQRQRVAVGRAIVRKPKVFLFDEPLSNLDAKMRVSMRAEISRLHDRLRATVIYVTHDQVEAMTMGDRICVMKDGVIQQVAEPLDLYQHPANVFVAGFIGSPPMNFFRGAVRRRNDRLEFAEAVPASGVTFPLDGRLGRILAPRVDQGIIAGVRPEDVVDLATGGAPTGGPQIDVEVDVVEPMGAETFLYLHAGPTAFVARVRPTHVYEVGQKLRVSFPVEKVHVFDGVTEQVLAAE